MIFLKAKARRTFDCAQISFRSDKRLAVLAGEILFYFDIAFMLLFALTLKS